MSNLIVFKKSISLLSQRNLKPHLNFVIPDSRISIQICRDRLKQPIQILTVVTTKR